MIKQYFTQAWAQLRQQPLMSAVGIAGTALAIFLIMLVVMMQQVKVAPFAPESNRDRFLHVKSMSISNSNWGEGTSNGPMSVQTARECFQSLKTPEAVTIYTIFPVSTPVSLPGKPAVSVDLRQTDDIFWRVFDFSFIEGKPYDKAVFDAGQPAAVLTESVARSLFGTTDVEGREFLLSHAPYRVAGVVKDVSTLADCAYGQVWVPYTSTGMDNDTWNDRHMGMMSCTILARSRDDFPAIRREAERRKSAYNTLIGKNGWELIYRNRPYDQEKNAIAFGPPPADYHLRYLADSACHQSFEHDAEPFASAGSGNRGTPCFRQYTHGADGANYSGESGDNLIGRYCRPAAERGFCVRGQYVAFCAGVQPDFESAGSGRFNPAACFHLCLGAALLLCAELDEQRFSGMARFTYRDSECIGWTVALNARR